MIFFMQKNKNALFDIREKKGLTQKDVAELIGTTANQISRLETGTRKLAPEWLERLSVALKCTKAELLGEEPEAGLNPEEQKLLEDFRALSPDKKENVRLILTALLNGNK